MNHRLVVVTACLLLPLLTRSSTNFLDFDGRNSNELCFICTCNDDRTTVDCSRRGLTEIPDGSGDMVQNLNISKNEISVFPSNLSRFYNLVTLDISSNLLRDLPENAFHNVTKLELLNLSSNEFEEWLNLNPNNFIKQAVNLKILDLSHNKFRTLGNLANRELLISSSLETLVLNDCEIGSIHGRSPVSGLDNLRVLKLNNNPLLRIQGMVSTTLKSLYLSNCLLTTIGHNDLLYLTSLLYLRLSRNFRLDLSTASTNLFSDSIRYLDISYCNIMQPSLQGFPNLRKVLINHNMIRYLRSNEFMNNSKLEHLDLSYNNIGSLRTDTFKGLSILKYLDLSWNEIANVPEDSLLDMPALTYINLSRNYLTRVGHLRSLSLNTVDMSQCEITTIGKDSFEGLQSLVDINLSRNLLSHIPDSISSNTLQYLNFNYNRISSISNYTFFMLPRLTGLGVIGNRFTVIWNKDYFQSNPYLERLDLSDNMWRCDCSDDNMYDFFEFVTLEPNKKEESYNLICNSPASVIGRTWLEACYYTWNPTEKGTSPDNVIWFIIVMIIGLALCLILVNAIKRSMKRRMASIQAERERQVEEARDRLRQLRMRAEQEALCNAPDPRDLVAPPSYDEALSMPKLNASCRSLCEVGTEKNKRKKGRRKTKSSGDLLEETERNGDVTILNDLGRSQTPDNSRRRSRRRRPARYGSHEITELEHSPGARRRHMSEFGGDGADGDTEDSVIVEVEAEVERPLRPRNRSHSVDDDEPTESNF
ncbi:insulin-like growth factor-binding protein complex acid labile subunit [Cydia pomonella]|uniref:insulin-like growth factor-binding protein complex acid labile subunit n=1 Tax=Cydia pomonella TaxID=82600 RepID=UPI002ADDA7BF|nr:insulin-like growth factor-binding protein complex acid labile subunit [Cydia pomonella]